jgi:hypothetical protein
MIEFHEKQRMYRLNLTARPGKPEGRASIGKLRLSHFCNVAIYISPLPTEYWVTSRKIFWEYGIGAKNEAVMLAACRKSDPLSACSAMSVEFPEKTLLDKPALAPERGVSPQWTAKFSRRV